jgi:hypothetical protein
LNSTSRERAASLPAEGSGNSESAIAAETLMNSEGRDASILGGSTRFLFFSTIHHE